MIVAMVQQPNPSTMGKVALPLSPIKRISRSDNMARRGRYPLSSIRPKAMKKVATTGRTMAIAYVSPIEIRPYLPNRISPRRPPGTNLLRKGIM